MFKRKSSKGHESRGKMSSQPDRAQSNVTSPLIAFYEGTGKDYRGRSLSKILSWDAYELEGSHDYIQTVFPLPESSGVIGGAAPTITREVFEAFRSRVELRDNLRSAFKKILWFYGFELEAGEGTVKVVKGVNFSKYAHHWDTRFDHNHLRISRIIRCLRVLGLEDEALAFRTALEETTRRVSDRSREYWRRAAERTLNIRPDLEIDDESDLSIGLKFLREFEEHRKELAQQPVKVEDEKTDGEVSEVKHDEDAVKSGAAEIRETTGVDKKDEHKVEGGDVAANEIVGDTKQKVEAQKESPIYPSA